MGFGDWIMASAQVKEVNERTGKKVLLGDGHRKFFDKEVFANNPRLAQDGENGIWVDNYPGNRPYIRGYEGKRILFNDDFSPTKGEIFFTKTELDWADRTAPKGKFIVVEPNVKTKFIHGGNKAWPHWKDVSMMNYPFIQLGDGTGTMFQNLITDSFREAMLILSRAALFVGTDGGLHHAAAALSIPAIVIWTGFTSPKHLGYENHVNIHDGGDPCGYFGGECQHCKKIAESIKPSVVIDAIIKEFK